jgi:hypothetical protein
LEHAPLSSLSDAAPFAIPLESSTRGDWLGAAEDLAESLFFLDPESEKPDFLTGALAALKGGVVVAVRGGVTGVSLSDSVGIRSTVGLEFTLSYD